MTRYLWAMTIEGTDLLIRHCFNEVIILAQKGKIIEAKKLFNKYHLYEYFNLSSKKRMGKLK